ncbi:hypothetical protein IAI10_23720 [Clostridium sp. 19966]|uniref:hypothetical protein n=1 Tax=Clostridium sp. 19966 TaxID=2768166 RepID=UPI0028DFCC12|nr:hypothetical protein [Clostridium sp. 19966]MDT8719653.1 hypothetical protein [Clostridium sp. 19966]
MKKFCLRFTIFLLSTFVMVKAQGLSEKCFASETIGPPLTLDQIKGQIYLYDQALKEFGAASPEQAVDIWAEGYKNRNGVMQYSVMCDKLKKQWLKDQGDPTNSFWIIGGSSPWLVDYTLLEKKKIR